MSINSHSSYKSKLLAPSQKIYIVKGTANSTVGLLRSYFITGLGVVNPSQAGAIPTTAAVPLRTITGSFSQNNSGSFQQRLWISNCFGQQRQNFMICDRLSHQGGLSGATNVAQTTNLPTAALTRYTNGVGVFAALEIYTQIGTTGTTATMSYTNQNGVAGRTSQAVDFGATDRREVGRFIIMSLQEGDIGVRSVESVTLAATTGTAGAFGVTLFKPLTVLPSVDGNVFEQSQEGDPLLMSGMNMPIVQQDACLWIVNYCASGGNSVLVNLTVSLAEDDNNS